MGRAGDFSSVVKSRAAGLAVTVVCAASLLAACGGGGSGSAGSGGTTTHTMGITITSAVAAGESFKFALQGTSQSVTVTQGGVSTTFSPALANGTSYVVNQTDGPRTCTLSANRIGTVTADIEITANCGVPAGKSALTGIFWGPIDSQVGLRNNGSDNLNVTVPPFNGGLDPYNQLPFTFASPLPDGSAFSVTLTAQPAGQTCSVFRGSSGTMPTAPQTVHVGCEYTNDLVSRNSDNAVKGTFYDSGAPSIGGSNEPLGATTQGYGEGRFVAFVSSAAGINGSTGGHRQIFWRDRMTGDTRLISASPDAVEGNADSFAPVISADGLHVVFESYASNLVANDTNGVRDVFIWSVDNGVLPTSVQRISVNADGVQANAESYQPTISADGRVVAFSSGASNLTAGVSGINTINVFLRDLAAGTIQLISTDSSGTGVGGSNPALSEDGKRLAFYSFSSTIVSGDTNNLWDIFVYDRTSAVTTRVSLTSGGGERNGGTESTSRVIVPAISGNGRYVAFATTASNMVSGDSNGAQDVFVVDTQTGDVVRASLSDSGAQGNGDSPVGQGERVALSFDGEWVAFSSSAGNLGAPVGNIVMRNLKTGKTRVVSNANSISTGVPSMSRTGAYVSYGASAQLDARFSTSGLFATFTGLSPAYFWQ